MEYFDVIIIGSGPAGAIAALELAKNKIKVAIVEKATLPRYKTCGGGLVYRGLKMIDFDISSVVEREFKNIIFTLVGDDLNFNIKKDVPIVSLVNRDKFDYFLIKKAVENGASLLENNKLLDIKKIEDLLHVKTSLNTYKAKFIIGADGALSPTAKIMGWKDNRYLIPALEYEVTVNDSDFERLSKEIRFDIDAIPRGYGWSFPKKNHLSIGVVSTSRGKVNLKHYYQEYLKILGITEILHEEKHGAQIPLSPRKEVFFKNNVLLVGDAAGFADPITAEGISNAMYSGKLAAQSIIEGKLEPEIVANLYASKLEVKLLPELKSSRIIANIFYSHKWVRKIIIKNYGQKFAEALTDIFLGRRNYPKDVKKIAKVYLKKMKIRL